MREPVGADRLLSLLDVALEVGGADEVEARAVHGWGGLARFAGNAIHQHVASDDTTISVRMVTGGRTGAATTNHATPTGVATAAARALAAARSSPPDARHPGVAGPARLPVVEPRFDEATAAATPARRAQALAQLLAALGPGQQAAGAISTSAAEVALATTAGARHHGLSTRAAASTVVTDGPASGGGASGHGEDVAMALDDLDPAGVGAMAGATAAAAVDPVAVTPGAYQVVLLPSAVATLVELLGGAFSAKAVAEGRSPFDDRLGQPVASALIDLADDPLAVGALGVPFDGEGTPRTRVPLLSRGRTAGVVHDRASARHAGATSTGHGLPAPNPWGPSPSHLVLVPGPSTVDDLVAGIEDGLVVSRFWYTRPVNPKRTLITGMTRDGTFRIEGGRRSEPVRSLRFNQSILEALASCDGVGDRLHRCGEEGAVVRVPALRLRSFTFTSVSDH